MGNARRAFVEQPDLTRDYGAATAADPASVASRAMLAVVPRRRVEPIVIDRLSKSFDGKPAVRNLSFIVEPGVVTGFLGPNGAGKTTTLRMLVGLAAPICVWPPR